MCIKNAGSAFYDEPMQLLRSNGFAEGFAEAVQEIENETLLDLDLLVRPLQPANPLRQEIAGNNPSGQTRDKQSEKKSRPHCRRASLLRGRLAMKVLF